MTHVDTAKFKALLEAELSKLEEELGTVGRRNPKNADDWEATPGNGDVDEADENVVADKIEQFEENVSILNDLEPQLVEVRAALKKIEAGTYGFCEVCQETIEPQRLEANPSAKTCMKHMN